MNRRIAQAVLEFISSNRHCGAKLYLSSRSKSELLSMFRSFPKKGASAAELSKSSMDGVHLRILPGGWLLNSHRDSVEDLVRRGRDMEKVALARAVKWHIEDRVLVYANKTVVFQ